MLIPLGELPKFENTHSSVRKNSEKMITLSVPVRGKYECFNNVVYGGEALRKQARGKNLCLDPIICSSGR